jgi:hypothetical protein
MGGNTRRKGVAFVWKEIFVPNLVNKHVSGTTRHGDEGAVCISVWAEK